MNLGDILLLSKPNKEGKKYLTERECAEIIEYKLMDSFPWIEPNKIFRKAHDISTSTTDYCHRLIELEKKLFDPKTYSINYEIQNTYQTLI